MMSRRSYAGLAVTALAVATLCFAVEPAWAQREWRGSNGRAQTWNGWGYGYGNPSYSGWYGPQDYYSSGWGNYPRYSGYSWGAPQYNGGWGNESAWTSPSYYGEGMGAEYSGAANNGMGYGQEAYGAMSPGAMDNRVLVTVRVPPNAQVWFDDQKTNQTGTFRTFISPPVNPNGNFVYHIRDRWTENGQPVEKTRRIEVAAGDRLVVNFFTPRQGMGGTSMGQMGRQGTSSQYGNEPGATGSVNENPNRSLENQPAPANGNPTTPPSARMLQGSLVIQTRRSLLTIPSNEGPL